MKIEELFEGGSFRMQRRKRNVFRMICLTAIVLVFTLVLLALVSIVSLVAGIIADANAPEIPNADIGPTDTIDIVDTKLHNGSLLILDEDNPYSGNKPKLFNLQARTDRPKIANGKDNAYTVLKAKQNSFMATDAAASALNKMIDGFYKAKKDDNIVIVNAYDQSKAATQDPLFATGEAFELKYFHDYENQGAKDPRSIANVELYSWIYKNAYKYGFVPFGGSDSNIFRYVGMIHSTAMQEKNLSFESYLNMLKNETSPASPIPVKVGANLYAIYFLNKEDKHFVPINYSYEISGNNVDGFIITVNLTK